MNPATQSVFTTIFRDHLWGSTSKSGPGSTHEQTHFTRAGLAVILDRFKPYSFLDIPCGDGEWIRPVFDSRQISYTGADIVPDLVEANRARWPNLQWQILDVCVSKLPKVDMVFCRDCLVHLPSMMVFEALRNIKESGARLLVTTTFPGIPEGNAEIPLGSWHRLDLTQEPYRLQNPLLILNECSMNAPNPGDKSLAVWKISDLTL